MGAQLNDRGHAHQTARNGKGKMTDKTERRIINVVYARFIFINFAIGKMLSVLAVRAIGPVRHVRRRTHHGVQHAAVHT